MKNLFKISIFFLGFHSFAQPIFNETEPSEFCNNGVGDPISYDCLETIPIGTTQINGSHGGDDHDDYFVLPPTLAGTYTITFSFMFPNR